MMNTPAHVDLLAQLRGATQGLHRELESAEVMRRLLSGRLPAPDFHLMQRNLQAIYAALEAALQRHAGLIQQHCAAWPRLSLLARSTRLVADLHQLHGPDWAQALPVLPATRAYVERLGELDRTAPRELLAHAYVRYLGDLAGGQLLTRRIQASYALPGRAGTSFFDFGSPEQAGALAHTLRQALQGCWLDLQGVAALTAEARWSFVQHARIFQQLISAEMATDLQGPR